MYDPQVGRFISEDPQGYQRKNFPDRGPITEANLYLYAGNNPVIRIDPSGKEHFAVGANGLDDVLDFLINNNVPFFVEDISDLGGVMSSPGQVSGPTNIPGVAEGTEKLYQVIVKPAGLQTLTDLGARFPEHYRGLTRWNYHTISGVPGKTRLYLTKVAARQAGRGTLYVDLEGQYSRSRNLLVRFNGEQGYGPAALQEARTFIINQTDPTGTRGPAGEKSAEDAVPSIEEMLQQLDVLGAMRRFSDLVQQFPGYEGGPPVSIEFFRRFVLKKLLNVLDADAQELLEAIGAALEGNYVPLVEFFGRKLILHLIRDDDWRTVVQELFRTVVTGKAPHWGVLITALTNKVRLWHPALGILLKVLWTGQALTDEEVKTVVDWLCQFVAKPADPDVKRTLETVRDQLKGLGIERGVTTDQLIEVLARLDDRLRLFRSLRNLQGAIEGRDTLRAVAAIHGLMQGLLQILPANEFEGLRAVLAELDAFLPKLLPLLEIADEFWKAFVAFRAAAQNLQAGPKGAPDLAAARDNIKQGLQNLQMGVQKANNNLAEGQNRFLIWLAAALGIAASVTQVLDYVLGVSVKEDQEDCRRNPKTLSFATGEEAEDYLRSLYAGSRKMSFDTLASLPWRPLRGAERRREVDAYDAASRFAHESKIGLVKLDEIIQKEIVKDEWLLRNDVRIIGAVWHFFCSANTGKIGPNAEVRGDLIAAAIEIMIHN